MTTHDNAPPQPDWQPEPRHIPLPTLVCARCERAQTEDTYGPYSCHELGSE